MMRRAGKRRRGSFLLRGEDVRRFGRRLVMPGFGMSEIVLPVAGV